MDDAATGKADLPYFAEAFEGDSPALRKYK